MGPRVSYWATSLKRSMWHLPCARTIAEDRWMCFWEEGQGISNPLLWNIILNCLNQTVALGKASLSPRQPTGCRVTPSSHFQTLLLGRSQSPGLWAGVWRVGGVRRGLRDSEEWVREPELLASRAGPWAKCPLQGGPAGSVHPKELSLSAREHSKARSLTRMLTPAPEAALGLEQGMQEVTQLHHIY